MGILEDKAEGRIEGADAIDLGQGPSVLLESLSLGFAAGKNTLDGIDELLLGLVILVELLVVGELLGRDGRHVCLLLLTLQENKELTINVRPVFRIRRRAPRPTL